MKTNMQDPDRLWFRSLSSQEWPVLRNMLATSYGFLLIPVGLCLAQIAIFGPFSFFVTVDLARMIAESFMFLLLFALGISGPLGAVWTPRATVECSTMCTFFLYGALPGTWGFALALIGYLVVCATAPWFSRGETYFHFWATIQFSAVGMMEVAFWVAAGSLVSGILLRFGFHGGGRAS